MPDLLNDQPTIRDDLPAVHARACEACGAPVEPLDRFCNACGMEQPDAAKAVRAEVVEPQRHLRCENCGAEVAIDPSRRSYTCAFCDSNYVIEFTPEQNGRQPPEFVVGFAITPEQAMQRFRAWLKANSWFRPGDLQMAEIEGKLQGAYIPFWSFSMLARSHWSASIGEYWYRTETYTVRQNGKTVTRTRRIQETEWWGLSGRHHQYYSGFLVSGSRGLSQQDAERIKPFHLAALRRYEPYFLAGWLSEEYSIDREAAKRVCEQEFYRMEQENVASFLPGDTHRSLHVETQFSDTGSDLILLPVYVLSYRYQDKLYRFLLNGQTGRADGDKPLSFWRIGVAAGVVAAIVLIVVLAAMLLSQM